MTRKIINLSKPVRMAEPIGSKTEEIFPSAPVTEQLDSAIAVVSSEEKFPASVATPVSSPAAAIVPNPKNLEPFTVRLKRFIINNDKSWKHMSARSLRKRLCVDKNGNMDIQKFLGRLEDKAVEDHLFHFLEYDSNVEIVNSYLFCVEFYTEAYKQRSYERFRRVVIEEVFRGIFDVNLEKEGENQKEKLLEFGIEEDIETIYSYRIYRILYDWFNQDAPERIELLIKHLETFLF